MILCVWYPDWPLRDAPRDEPSFAIRASRVVAANDAARRAGVERGLSSREAEALCPTASVHDQDLGADLAAFEPVVSALEAVVPRVEIAEPGLAFVLLEGAIAYFGGVAPLVESLVEAASAVAPGGRFGVAHGPFAAQRAASSPPKFVEDDASFLATLDIGAIGAEELVDTFRWLGVLTLGDLARLPRGAIASRFGTVGLDAHRLASGEDRRPGAREVPADMAVEDRYEDPLDTMDQVGFAARRLAHRLMVSLAGAAPHRVEIEAETVTGRIRSRVWRSADPFDSSSLAERTWWQVRAWVEVGGTSGGVMRLRITPADVSDEGRQMDLLEGASGRLEAERALGRAQALLGGEGVWKATPRGGRDPADRVAWHRWGEEEPLPARSSEAPWPGGVPAPSPALVPREPKLFDVDWEGGSPVRVRLRSRWEQVTAWAGPWRRTGRWWVGESHADRYQIVTTVGAFLCEVRDGKVYLVGIYD